MQQLTAQQLSRALTIEADIIRLHLALPDSVAMTHQWVRQFCEVTGAILREQEWGADRYQAHIQCGAYRLLMCIEWLCEAVWLEPDAGETHSLHEIAGHIRDVSSQKAE